MLRFLLGAAIGAAGYWAYREFMGNPEQSSGYQGGGASSWNPTAGNSTIARPSASEIAGRPAEPLPRVQPE